MNYFTSGIHGNLNVYNRIKKLLKNDDDHLWILGDILDGNSTSPEDCIKILKDIDKNCNIHLILGEHEYFHVLRLLSVDEPENFAAWEDSLIDFEVSGRKLVDYLNTLSKDELNEITGILKESEVSEIIKIGSRFFYLCYGAPAYRKNVTNRDMVWQYSVVTDTLDFKHSYSEEFQDDFRMEEFRRIYGEIDLESMFIIAGQMTMKEAISQNDSRVSGIPYVNRKFALNQNRTFDNDNPEDPWKVLAISETSLFIIDV